MLMLVSLTLWKIVDLVISLVSPYYLPYLGHFAYRKDMLQYNLPDFLRSLTNFDGIYYIRIALHGYQQYEQAYFPLYPILIKFTLPVTNNSPVFAGLLISHIAFILAFYILSQFLRFYIKAGTAVWFLIFLLVYPTSYYFGVMYTESVFLLMFISSLYCFKRNWHAAAFIFAYLTGLTRVVGVLLAIPYGMLVLEQVLHKHPREYIAIGIKNVTTIALVCAPILGLVSYSYYLWSATGDPLYFFHAQEHFGANRSTHLVLLPQVIYRYIRIFMTASHNFQYFVALLEFCFLFLAMGLLALDFKNIITRKKKDFMRIGLNLFSWANIIVPSLTGTLTALPRYTLLSIAIFFALAEIQNTKIKLAIIACFIILHIIMFAFFVQGYYVT